MKAQRLIVYAGVTFLVVGMVFGAYHWINQPSVTNISSPPPTAASVLSSEQNLTQLTTDMFSTRYPSSYRVIKTNTIAQGATDEQHLLGASNVRFDDQLAVSVGKLGQEPLGSLSAIRARQLQPNDYKRVERAYVSTNGYVFERKSPYELAAYWSDGNRYAAVVVSGGVSRAGTLENALQTVVTNWTWR